MGFLDKCKDLFSGLVRSKSVSLVSDTTSDWGSSGSVNTYRGTRHWVQTYKRNSLLGSVISRIATDVSRGGYRLYEMTGQSDSGDMILKLVHEHPLWAIWQNPNPDMSGQEYRKLGVEWLETSGIWLTWIEREEPDQFDWKTGKRVQSEPKHLWPIEPWNVQQRPTVSRPYWLIRWKDEIMVVPPWDVVYIRYIDPEYPYRMEGASPAQRVADDVAGYEYASQWNLNFFRNGANMGKIIGLPTTKENSEAFRTHFESNYIGNKNSHKAYFVGTGADGKAQVSVVDLQKGHKDMDYGAGMIAYRNRICQNWNMPPSILGDTGDKPLTNEEEQLYAENCLEPKMDFISEQFNRQLLGEYDDTPRYKVKNLIFGYISPVKATREFELDKANDGLTRGGTTLDDYRRARGEDPWGNELGNCITLPANTVLVSKDQTPEEVQQMLLERSGKTAPEVANAPSTPTNPGKQGQPEKALHRVVVGGSTCNGRVTN